MTEAIAVLVSALVLAATHVFAGRLRFLDVVPRSFAGSTGSTPICS